MSQADNIFLHADWKAGNILVSNEDVTLTEENSPEVSTASDDSDTTTDDSSSDATEDTQEDVEDA